MRTNVIVFIEGNQTFTNTEEIENYNISKVIKVYKETAVIHDMINDLGEMIALGAVKSVNCALITGEFVDMLGDGLAALRKRIIHRLGEDSANLIFKETLNYQEKRETQRKTIVELIEWFKEREKYEKCVVLQEMLNKIDGKEGSISSDE